MDGTVSAGATRPGRQRKCSAQKPAKKRECDEIAAQFYVFVFECFLMVYVVHIHNSWHVKHVAFKQIFVFNVVYFVSATFLWFLSV